MNLKLIFEEYEKTFDERVFLPFHMPSYITIDDFLKHIQHCIDTGVPYDQDEFLGETPYYIVI